MVPMLCGFAMQADAADLSGRVVDRDGIEIPNVEISLFAEGGRLVAEAITGDDGDWAIAALPPGHYEIVASSPRWFEVSRVEIDVGTASIGIEHVLALRAPDARDSVRVGLLGGPRELSGRVVDSRGMPIGDVLVEASPANGVPELVARTDRNGEWRAVVDGATLVVCFGHPELVYDCVSTAELSADDSVALFTPIEHRRRVRAFWLFSYPPDPLYEALAAVPVQSLDALPPMDDPQEQFHVRGPVGLAGASFQGHASLGLAEELDREWSRYRDFVSAAEFQSWMVVHPSDDDIRQVALLVDARWMLIVDVDLPGGTVRAEAVRTSGGRRKKLADCRLRGSVFEIADVCGPVWFSR